MHFVIIALGSNRRQAAHIHWASERLATLLTDLRLSPAIWTADVHATGTYYINRLAMGYTRLPADELQQTLKSIETATGRSADGVTIDLDLMQYGQQRYHHADWPRPYIQRLIGRLRFTRRQRYDYLIAYFRQQMPHAATELEFGSVFQLLVAVVLSAQCTDKRINQVTPALFSRFPDAASMAAADEGEILHYISSVSYPNAKASHLAAMSRMLVERFGGEVPSAMPDLLSLPGVGRKTANVIQSVAFGQSALAVDTHVFRVSHRLGLVSRQADTPYKVEQELIKNIPAEDIPQAHHWLLLHGRYICTSRRPHCERCPFSGVCPSASTAARVSASSSSSGGGIDSRP